MSDVITLHAIAGNAGQWCHIRLRDGGSDNTVYDRREAAFAHAKAPAFTVQVPPGGVSAAEAEEVLHYHRELFDTLGARPLELPLLMPLTRADQRRQIAALRN